MSQRGDLMIQSFLEIDGLEISNGARTIQYLRNGLGSDRWQVGEGCACNVLWEEICPSVAGPEQCFISPEADPAPWWDPDTPESADFLGVLIKDVRPWFDGQAARSITPRISGLGGASIGPTHLTPRALTTPATLIASSCGGIEYGRRWLQYQLNRLCDPCQLSVARIRSFCPTADDDLTAGEWFVYEVGLVSGMDEVLQQDGFGQASFAGGDDGCCDFVEGTLTLMAGNPYLYKRAIICAGPESLNPDACAVDCIDFCHWLQDAPPAVDCVVEPPLIGVLGTVITIDAGTGLHNLTLETLADCDDPTSLIGSIGVPFLPAGSTFVVDSALHTITYTPSGGTPVDGTPYIVLPFGFGVPWLEVGSCNPAGCVRAQLGRICDSDCTPTVEIDLRLREG
jgi:hypothetical protein